MMIFRMPEILSAPNAEVLPISRPFVASKLAKASPLHPPMWRCISSGKR